MGTGITQDDKPPYDCLGGGGMEVIPRKLSSPELTGSVPRLMSGAPPGKRWSHPALHCQLSSWHSLILAGSR